MHTVQRISQRCVYGKFPRSKVKHNVIRIVTHDNVQIFENSSEESRYSNSVVRDQSTEHFNFMLRLSGSGSIRRSKKMPILKYELVYSNDATSPEKKYLSSSVSSTTADTSDSDDGTSESTQDLCLLTCSRCPREFRIEFLEGRLMKDCIYVFSNFYSNLL